MAPERGSEFERQRLQDRQERQSASDPTGADIFPAPGDDEGGEGVKSVNRRRVIRVSRLSEAVHRNQQKSEGSGEDGADSVDARFDLSFFLQPPFRGGRE